MLTTQRRISTPRGRSLSAAATIGDVKRFLCHLIKRVDRGRCSVQRANCMGQLCNVLINTIMDHELEKRLDLLEAERAGARRAAAAMITIEAEETHHDETETPAGTA